MARRTNLGVSSATSELKPSFPGSTRRRIFLDNHSTTPVDPRVVEVMTHFMREEYGNPSSAEHSYGDMAHAAVESAREEVAQLVGVPSRSVIFVSGATEGANLVLSGLARRFHPKQLRVALSPTEHVAVLDTCRRLALDGRVVLQWLRVDAYGHVDLSHLREVLATGVDLVCAMWANNEIGTVAYIEEIAALAAESGAAVFSDITQAAGKLPTPARSVGVQLLTLSAHKMYGPKGAGAVVIPAPDAIVPLFFGGGQERGLRPGTLNVPAIAGFGEACRLRRVEMGADEPRIASMRNSLQTHLQQKIPGVVVNGDPGRRLAGSLHVSLSAVPNTALVARLRDRLAISTGSACSSGAPGPSHVLRAIGMAEDLMRGAIRIGIGKFNTVEEVESAAELITSEASDLLKVSHP